MTTDHDPAPGTELVPVDPPDWLSVDSARLPEIVSQPQPSLAQLIAEANTPPPGETEPSPVRQAWLIVQIPVTAAAYGIQWAFRSPERAAAAIVLVLVVATALARIDATAWLIPSFLDIASWF